MGGERTRGTSARIAVVGALLVATLASCKRPHEESASGGVPAAATRPQAPAEPPKPQRDDGAPGPQDPPPFEGERFTWMRDALPGWRHVTSESGEYRMPEVTCGGVVLFDFDGDDDLDVFLVNGGTWNDLTPGARYPGHALFRNEGGLRFTNVAREAGVFGVDGTYCMGAAAADFDNDGDQDLHVTGFNGDFLYLNDGKGTFSEIGEKAGVRGDGRWSASSCFFDADRDGRLDLYVANYLDFKFKANRELQCGVKETGMRDYCAPAHFFGVQDWFFHNEGDGRFKECALAVGLEATKPLSDNAKGLGVVAFDAEDDGDPDLYVANDGCANFLFLNDGTGRFSECGTVRGCAYSEDGRSQAGMGVDSGDVDLDGDLDLWVVNLDLEKNCLYRNDGKGWFTDEARSSGIAAVDTGQVGFGTDLFDWDDDGDLDLMIANGHVLVNVHRTRGTLFYKQQDQLLENDGTGRFRLVAPSEAGAWFLVRNAGRGLATGDLDGDGDLDVVTISRDEPAVLLRNNHQENRHVENRRVESRPRDAPGRRADCILLRLVGTKSNRDAVGSRVRVTAAGHSLVEEVKAGSSYCSRNDLRLHFGLGAAPAAEKVDVRWPTGVRESFGPLEAGYEYTLTEGGKAERRRELRSAAK